MNPSLITILVACCCALVACNQKSDEKKTNGPRVLKVKFTTVAKQAFADEVEALGTVRAMEAINISANVTETVTAVSFEDGQTVEKGTILAQLSTSEEVAMLEGAKINLAEQQREVDRLRKLTANGAVSQVSLHEYLTARDLALQKIEEAKAKIADRVIVAPFDGVLGFRQVSVGTLVAPGDVLATLDLIDTVKLDFSVPETFLSDLGPGLKIIAHSDAYPGEDFEGTVTDVNARIDPITRSALVRAIIPNAGHKLRPGMLMTTLIKKNPTSAPAIPERAVVSVQSRNSVFLIEGEGDAAKAKEIEITLGRRVPGYVEVIDGLKGGEPVIVDGLIGLRDGGSIIVLGEADGPAKAYSPTNE